MKAGWYELLGDLAQFLEQAPQLARRFQDRVKATRCDLAAIRAFVKSTDYVISDDPDLFREVVGAFVCVLKDYYAGDIKVRGILKKRIVVLGPGYCGDLLDLFYRCVFEGLDLAPEGEGLARPV